MHPISRNIRLMKWYNFLSEFLLHAPIRILYFGEVAGTYTLGMSVFSVIMLAQFVLEVPTGILSDRLGRRKTVIISAVARLLAVVVYAAATNFALLVIAALFEGLGRAFSSGNNEALVYETLAETGGIVQYEDVSGKTGAMGQFGLGIGAVLGGFAATISYRLTVVLTIIPMLLSLLISFGFVEPRNHSRTHLNPYEHLGEALRSMLRNRSLRLITLASALSFAVGETAFQLRTVFIQTLWPTWALGLARMVANLASALSFYFAGSLIRRFGEMTLLIGGKGLMEASNVVCLVFPTVFSPLIMALNSVFHGVNVVAAGSLLQHQFSDEQRATMGSLSSFAGSVLLAIVSPLLGALADHFGVVTALVIAALFTVFPLVFYWLGLRPGDKNTVLSAVSGTQPNSTSSV